MSGPVLVGERASLCGSRRFRELVSGGRLTAAWELATAQLEAGAGWLDLCLIDPARDERADLEALLAAAPGGRELPLMIDSRDPEVFALALERAARRGLPTPILNGVDLADGGAALPEVARLGREHHARIVVGCSDQGEPVVECERKLAVAARAVEALVGLGVERSSLIVDPLAFPEHLRPGAGAETLDAIARLGSSGLATLVAISNVSWGLAADARREVEIGFFERAVAAGLGFAIVHTGRLLQPATVR